MALKLSHKHGVNPTIPRCFYCWRDKNELILAGRLRDDAEAPKNSVWDMNPCSECEGYMEQGVIFISVRDGEMEKVERELEIERANYSRTYNSLAQQKRHPFHFVPNPYRTGGWAVVTAEAVERWMESIVDNPFVRKSILEQRWAFLPDEVWDAIGLPRGGNDEIDSV